MYWDDAGAECSLFTGFVDCGRCGLELSVLAGYLLRILICALARRFSWLECRPVHQKVVGSIPSQGTYLGCGFEPWWGMEVCPSGALALSKSMIHWG